MQALWQLDRVSLRGTDCVRLNDVSCSIHSGITAILGESGAGKTSLLNLLTGMERPDSGSIRHPPSENGDFRLPLFWAPQGGGLWPHLSLRRHLSAVCQTTERSDKLLDEFDLSDRQHAFPDELSQGERRAAVGRSIAGGSSRNPAVRRTAGSCGRSQKTAWLGSDSATCSEYGSFRDPDNP